MSRAPNAAAPAAAAKGIAIAAFPDFLGAAGVPGGVPAVAPGAVGGVTAPVGATAGTGPSAKGPSEAIGPAAVGVGAAVIGPSSDGPTINPSITMTVLGLRTANHMKRIIALTLVLNTQANLRWTNNKATKHEGICCMA
jgi:hypothetical protein